MKKSSDMATKIFNNNASIKQSLTDGKESSLQKTNNQGINHHQTGSSKTCVTIGAIDRVFLKLQARYGNQWTSQWSDPDMYKLATNEWYDGLKHFDLLDVKHGLETYNGDYPPNLEQFKKACTSDPVANPAPCYNEYKAIPVQKSTPEYGKQQLDKIHGYLR